MCFDVEKVARELDSAFRNDSETELLAVLKGNSFLFYPLYSRKYGIEPNFSEVTLGSKYRIDFCWLNDNSDGPQWVLVEIEKPKLKLFNASSEPTSQFNHAIEQVRSWSRYFKQHPSEKRRIFGAVARFRYILVVGSKDEWETKHGAIWRADFNEEQKIEIRSADIFFESLRLYTDHEAEFWSFKKNPVSLNSKELEKYWSNHRYIQYWRSILT